ncbi:histidine phosphatase family protein [Paenibacillus sp. CMAA1364]
MRIGLIRHGITDWNMLGKIQGQTDIPLNDEGRAQAAILGERLLQEPYAWDSIISSGLQRAEETGSIISSILSIPMLEPDKRLLERSFGQVEGLTAEERELKWGKDWNQLELGQEKNEDIKTRGLDFLEEMWNVYPNRNILVISHGAFLAQLYIALYNDMYMERIGNLSLTILEKDEEKWSPLVYNCSLHLLEKTNNRLS